MDAWAWPTDPDDFDGDVELQGMEWERTAGALVGDEMAGVHSVYTLRMPVPGGDVPTAGLTWVGVHPQHRRRGVLTAMMRHHLDSAHASGEPVSALWASEPAIYGRYGYGMATRAVRLTLPRGAAMVDVTAEPEVLSVGRWRHVPHRLRPVRPVRGLSADASNR